MRILPLVITLMFVGILMVLVTILEVDMTVLLPIRSLSPSNTTTTKKSSDQQEWSCTPKQNGLMPVGHAPLVLFAQPRTGSTFLLSMIQAMVESLEVNDTELLSYKELFCYGAHNKKHNALTVTLRAMEESCQATSSSNPLELDQQIATDMDTKWREEPLELLSFLANLPSFSKSAYFAWKVFDSQLQAIQLTPGHLVNHLASSQPKYVLLWRRRLIEQFVSEEIASVAKSWQGGNTNDQRVRIDQPKLQHFIEENRAYYKNVKGVLEASSETYLVLEYSQDLEKESDQKRTMERIADYLGLDQSGVDVETSHQNLRMEKQATVPLSEQVLNWEEVVEWGYSGETGEWLNLFEDVE